ncbi:MAG: hypothetical protein HY906_22180 [Deltaproteobacteria bacterium]|nr:hypothetical protein [Deltaproteobacteria bacterium]
MTTDTQAVHRSGTRGRLPTGLLAALGMAALVGSGCTPDIPTESPSVFFEFQFDPSSTPPKAYEPNLLVTNPETQRIDFSVGGIIIPEDPLECQTQTALSVAQCELYWSIQGLDGFPTLTPGRTPVSAALDTNTLTLPGNVLVYEFMRGQSPVTALDVAYDAADGVLTIDPQEGWELGGLYLVSLRGYASGVKDLDGNEGVKSQIYSLLKQEDSLSCGATTLDEIHAGCTYYNLFAGDARFKDLPPAEQKAALGATLLQLEQLRQLYRGELPGGLPFSAWDAVAEKGEMPPEEVGILWAFRTHTASVIELNPNKGLVPVVTAPTEIRIPVKGPIQEDTLKPFSLTDATGTVFLLDATAFLGGDFLGALPAFATTYENGAIVLTTSAALVQGHLYMTLVTTEVEGKAGVPIVPSPVTVLLRTRGALVDDFAGCPAQPDPTCPPTAPPTDLPTAKSLVSGLKAAEACLLEDGRQQFQALLDNQMVLDLTKTADRPNGLTRELVAFMYGLTYCGQ